MNVQIAPLQTPESREDSLDEHVGHTRTYVIGGVVTTSTPVQIIGRDQIVPRIGVVPFATGTT